MQRIRIDYGRLLMSLSLLLACLCCNSTSTQAQSLEGCVMLNDSTPAAYATIYVPALGLGTITDQDGRYLLDEIPLGTHSVEYSYLGYRTARRDLIIDKAGRMAHDERLEEQPIELTMYTSPQTAKTPLFIYCAKWQRKRPSTGNVWPVITHRSRIRSMLRISTSCL